MKEKTTVYLILREADMVEGRGPMVPVKIIGYFADAIKFIEKQSGIMGRKGQKAYQYNKESGRYYANDHELRPFIVE